MPSIQAEERPRRPSAQEHEPYRWSGQFGEYTRPYHPGNCHLQRWPPTPSRKRPFQGCQESGHVLLLVVGRNTTASSRGWLDGRSPSRDDISKLRVLVRGAAGDGAMSVAIFACSYIKSGLCTAKIVIYCTVTENVVCPLSEEEEPVTITV